MAHIRAFFAFDPKAVPDEPRPTDDECQNAKIVYYFPSYAAHEEKRSQVSLIEGLVAFTRQFESDAPLECLRTDEFLFAVFEVEPSLWFTLVVQLPADGLTDAAALAILRNCHVTFYLLHGPMQKYIVSYGSLKLIDLLEDFIPAYMHTVDYTFKLPGGETSLFTQLQGFHYGPVERSTYVSIGAFLQRMHQQCPGIRHSCLLYHAHLIYSGLSLNDMKVLYNYLVLFNGVVRTTKLNQAPFARIPTAASHIGGSSSFGRCHLIANRDVRGQPLKQDSSGCFLFGVGESSGYFVPAVYLVDAGEGRLVVFCYKGIMLVLIFHVDAPLDASVLDMVRSAAITKDAVAPEEDGHSLVELQPLIAKQFSQVMDHDDGYRFVYYNRANNALRLSNRTEVRTKSEADPSLMPLLGDEMETLAPLYDELDISGFREINFKEADRGWIVVKRALEREFFLLLDNASMTLARCQEECSRFSSMHFAKIFML